MDWVTLVINIATSLVGGSIGGTLISYLLDRRRINAQRRAGKTKLCAQLCHDLKRIKESLNIEQLSLDMRIVDQLLGDLNREQVEHIYAKIDEMRNNVQFIRQRIEQLRSQNEKILLDTHLLEAEFELRRDLVQLYEIFATPLTGHNVGIFKNPAIPSTRGKCGRWGIASPEWYYNELKQYGARFINPFGTYDMWKKYKVIINPYGEYYFVKNDKELTNFINTIKTFIENGGIWVHTGGYPFYAAFIWKRKKEESGTTFIAEELGIIVEQVGSVDVATVIPEGVRYLGRMNWRCEDGARSVRNADTVYAMAKYKESNVNVLASKIIGNGLFLHYGGLHNKFSKEVNKVEKIMCQLLKNILLVTQ